MSILIYKNDEQHGPFDLATIQQGLSEGSLSLDDPAWKEGCGDWVPLRALVAVPPPLTETAPSQTSKSTSGASGRIHSAISNLLSEEQDPAVVQKIINKAQDLLTKGEVIEYIGVQKKPVVTISPDAVLLTNKRFMIVRPKLMGMTFDDHLWREVADVHMSEQLMGATISCSIVGGKRMSIDSIPKKQARRIYSYAQEIEERMHDERRRRDMEDKRASAGGVVIHSAVPQGPPPIPAVTQPPQRAEDPLEILGKLKKMLDAGLIEQSEYDSKKTELLARM